MRLGLGRVLMALPGAASCFYALGCAKASKEDLKRVLTSELGWGWGGEGARGVRRARRGVYYVVCKRGIKGERARRDLGSPGRGGGCWSKGGF